MSRRLDGRLGRLEAKMPVLCAYCGRVASVDSARSTLILFELDGQLMKHDRTPVAREDLAPCRGCRIPKEVCSKIIVGVRPWLM